MRHTICNHTIHDGRNFTITQFLLRTTEWNYLLKLSLFIINPQNLELSLQKTKLSNLSNIQIEQTKIVKETARCHCYYYLTLSCVIITCKSRCSSERTVVRHYRNNFSRFRPIRQNFCVGVAPNDSKRIVQNVLGSVTSAVSCSRLSFVYLGKQSILFIMKMIDRVCNLEKR